MPVLMPAFSMETDSWGLFFGVYGGPSAKPNTEGGCFPCNALFCNGKTVPVSGYGNGGREAAIERPVPGNRLIWKGGFKVNITSPTGPPGLSCPVSVHPCRPCPGSVPGCTKTVHQALVVTSQYRSSARRTVTGHQARGTRGRVIGSLVRGPGLHGPANGGRTPLRPTLVPLHPPRPMPRPMA